jgi:O-methyltransferase involved in polyketide biosynthesis
METVNLTERNYNSISPTAKWLLVMKGHTKIPFAKEAAELLKSPPDFAKRDSTFWARTMHFEIRYRSIDQLLEDLYIKNILELSSGFSFRGLETTKQRGYHYIDTDLPEVIDMKREFTTILQNGDLKIEGNLKVLPLNALDEEQFKEVVSHFPEGELVIVNEGLLMYLDTKEKERLCSIIHKILKERGGYWISADIYIRNKQRKTPLKINDKLKAFYEKHQIMENMFDSFEDAEAFFNRMGFEVDKEAKIKWSKLSSMKYLLKSITLKQVLGAFKTKKIHATWRLRVV